MAYYVILGHKHYGIPAVAINIANYSSVAALWAEYSQGIAGEPALRNLEVGLPRSLARSLARSLPPSHVTRLPVVTGRAWAPVAYVVGWQAALVHNDSGDSCDRAAH